MVSHSESSLNAISRMSPPHAGHSSGNSSPTRAISLAQAIREVSCERADSGCAAVSAANHGEPFERKGRPGKGSQQVFETLKIARYVAVEERDPDTRVD